MTKAIVIIIGVGLCMGTGLWLQEKSRPPIIDYSFDAQVDEGYLGGNDPNLCLELISIEVYDPNGKQMNVVEIGGGEFLAMDTIEIYNAILRLQVALKATGIKRYDPNELDNVPGKNFRTAYENYCNDVEYKKTCK